MVETIFEYSYTLITILFLVIAINLSLNKENSLKKIILIWISFGILFNLYSLSWLYTTYPLSWIEPGYTQLLGIGLLHIISSIITGVSFFVVGFSFNKKIKTIYKPIIFALSLSFAEILRSLFISLSFSLDGNFLGLNWTAGTIGNAISTTPFIEYAYFGGTYALTFVLGLIIYVFISKENIKTYWKYAAGLVLGLFFIHFLIPTFGPNTETKIGVITTNFRTPKTIEQFKDSLNYRSGIINGLTFTFLDFKPDIFAYPEDSRYIENISIEEKKTLWKHFNKSLFVDGSTTLYKDKISNFSIFYDIKMKKISGRGKHFLFPFNEYIPTIYNYFFKLFINGEYLDDYKKNHSYSPQDFSGSYLYDQIKVGTLICSEILSYKTISLLKKTKPNIIIYQSYLNVFHNNPWFLMHLRSFSKIAAAQTRTPIISSSNGAPSYMISPYGKIEAEIKTGFYAKGYLITGDKILEIK